MRQVLHIFTKDVRRLKYPAALVLAATASFTYADVRPWAQLSPNAVMPYAFNAKPLIVPNDTGGTFSESAFVVTTGEGGLGSSSSEVSILPGLLILAWCWLIALVVYTDAIPGDRQFWLTRPYDRRSLWGAKTLFVLAFVNLPIFIAQAVILRVDGLPILPNLPGLLWDHVLITAIITMPVMALAALTRRMTHFVSLFVVGGLVAAGLAPLFMQIYAKAFLPSSSGWYLEGSRLGALNWVEDAVGIVAIAAFAVAVLFLQFMRRKTSASRFVAAAGAIVGIAAFWFVPWSPVFAVQSQLAQSQGDSVRAELTRPQHSTSPAYGVTDRLNLHFHVAGVPAGTFVACEAATVTVETPSAAIWRSGVIWLNSRIAQTSDGCQVEALVDNAFFNDNRNRQAHVRSTLYLTVFGDERTASMRLGAEPAAIPDVGICRAMPLADGAPAILCRAAFRWPPGLVWSRDAAGRGDVFTETMSYSPFPSDLRVSPVDSFWARAFPNQSGEVTIVSQKPIAHVRTDADLSNVLLGDLESGVR
jgi:hypothetical protein